MPNRVETNLNVTFCSSFFTAFPSQCVQSDHLVCSSVFYLTVGKAYSDLNLFQKKHDVNPLRGFLVPLVQVSNRSFLKLNFLLCTF